MLEQLREGGTNAEIGARLGISADAVKFHISNMLGKLGLQGRHELAAWRPATRRGRLRALFGVPAAVVSVAKPVVWVGVGAAAVAGVAVAAIAAVAVMAVVLVGLGGDGEPTAVVRLAVTDTSAPTPSVTPIAPAPALTATPTPPPTAAPTATPAAAPERTSISYHQLDASGAAARAGSYAFLQQSNDLSSAIDDFESLAGTIELRIHSTDREGSTHEAFYDAVKVGDTFDFKLDPLLCGVRFRVTNIGGGGTPRTFGIEYVLGYRSWLHPEYCPRGIREAHAKEHVDFVWGAGHGVGPAGSRALILYEPTGGGTYRLFEGTSCIVDVPADMQVYLASIMQLHYTEGMNGPRLVVDLADVNGDSALRIELGTCTPGWVYGSSLRRIVESLRIVGEAR